MKRLLKRALRRNFAPRRKVIKGDRLNLPFFTIPTSTYSGKSITHTAIGNVTYKMIDTDIEKWTSDEEEDTTSN